MFLNIYLFCENGSIQNNYNMKEITILIINLFEGSRFLMLWQTI